MSEDVEKYFEDEPKIKFPDHVRADILTKAIMCRKDEEQRLMVAMEESAIWMRGRCQSKLADALIRSREKYGRDLHDIAVGDIMRALEAD